MISADSPLVGQTASEIMLRSRYSVNLLAITWQVTRINKRINQVRFKTGDVLLLQGRDLTIADSVRAMSCLPLAPLELNIGSPRQIALVLSIFTTSILIVVFGLLPVQMAFAMGAVSMVLVGIIPVIKIYTSID